MRHDLATDQTPDSIIGDCACGGFFIESHGRDESSRAAVKSAFEDHEATS